MRDFATFMGMEGQDNWFVIHPETLVYKIDDDFVKDSDLKFDKEWNALMPVVEKIQTHSDLCLFREGGVDKHGAYAELIVWGKINVQYYWHNHEQLKKEIEEQRYLAEKHGEEYKPGFMRIADSKFDAIYQCARLFVEWYAQNAIHEKQR